MAASLNQLTIIGNLGRDPELKMTPGGQAVCRFSVATTEEWKNAQGEKQSRTDWHNCQAWGKLAEIIEKYARKGQQVLVQGRVQYRDYQVEGEAKKRQVAEVRVDTFKMLGGKREGGEGSSSGYDEPQGAPAAAGGGYDDDIPF